MNKFVFTLLIAVLGLLPDLANATCWPKYNGYPGSDYTGGVPLVFGNVRLQPDEYQPVGIIATTQASLAQASALSGPNTLMFQCDISDQGQTFEYFATNGDSNVGGFSQVDQGTLGEGVYQTFFPRIGIKIIHDNSGETYSRYWKRSPISGHIEGGKLNFYLRDFSSVTAQLFKLSYTDRTNSNNLFGCLGPAADNYQGEVTCKQPNAYTVFVGPGWNDNRLIKPGTDSAYYYDGYTVYNWIGIGLIYSSANRLYQTPFGCRVSNYTPVVTLPPITAAQLASGDKVGVPFSIDYKCDGDFFIANNDGVFNMVISDNTSSPYGNVSAAFMLTRFNDLDYPMAGNTAPYLLSDNYGQPGYATGVGIAIEPANGGGALSFIKSNRGGGVGWFPLNTGLQSTEKNGAQRIVHARFNAYYHKFDTVTPGIVDATAYILIRYQ